MLMLGRCTFFHRWTKWSAYNESGYKFYSGFLVSKELQGKRFAYVEKRQRRTCNDCGKTQDELISYD